MTVTASRIFDSLAKVDAWSVERHEVSCTSFSLLRGSVRRMITSFRESDDADGQEAANHLQRALSEWLTLPVPFDENLSVRLLQLGQPAQFRHRWGSDMGTLYEAALQAAADLARRESPARMVLLEQLADLKGRGADFRIFCHRNAVPLFDELMRLAGMVPVPQIFLHSCSGYRDCAPFETLLKIGPLRSRGWGTVPDAILTAPRFASLVQIVWSGCKDEPDFGYDPVIAFRAEGSSETGGLREKAARELDIGWTPRILHEGDTQALPLQGMPDVDEFQMFAEWTRNSNSDGRPAILVQVDEGRGLLYSPLSRLLCFDPMKPDMTCIEYRIAGETLEEDTFLVRPVLEETGSAGPKARHGRFSRIWKECLAKRCRAGTAQLVRQLEKEGLHLLCPEQALHHWVKPPTTVIHAPKQKRHFEILVRVLGVDFSAAAPSYYSGQLWEHAWREICHSRGEAIHAGFMSHAQAEEQLEVILNAMIPEIRRQAAGNDGFSLAIADGLLLEGVLLFNRIRTVEQGFRVPESELRLAHDLSEVEQWRA